MPPAASNPQPKPEVRQAVANLLTRSEAFCALPLDRKREVARATALVADYLAAPEGIPGNTLAGGLAMPTARALVGAFLHNVLLSLNYLKLPVVELILPIM